MSDNFRIVGGVILIAALIGLIVYATCGYIKERRRCTDNGGEWVKYNCRTETDFSCSSDSNGNLECHTDTYQRCDERCDGANPEARP